MAPPPPFDSFTAVTSPVADVIVVLGARVLPDGSSSAALQRRVARASAAFSDGVAPALICAGGRRWNARAEAVHIREQLVRLGVDEGAVHVELFSMTTAEKPSIARNGVRRSCETE